MRPIIFFFKFVQNLHITSRGLIHFCTCIELRGTQSQVMFYNRNDIILPAKLVTTRIKLFGYLTPTKYYL